MGEEMPGNFFDISEKLLKTDEAVLRKTAPRFAGIERVRDENQWRMLAAFRDCGVAARHLSGTTGYGYNDDGRDKLEQVFARLVGAESALFRHNFMSGTHALAVALFGVLRPGDELLCATGRPYDTLGGVLGLTGEAGAGSLRDFGVRYHEIELAPDGGPDCMAIASAAPGAAVLYLQRSRGYASRRALTNTDIASAATAAKRANPRIRVMVDNCYGEFVEAGEPTAHGADLIVGSLIKNPGGGIAPTGGYIAGKARLVELCANRLTAPGVGAEIGCTQDMLRGMYLGLYFAPGVVAEALKTAVYASALFEMLGFCVSPGWNEARGDIITAVELGTPARLERFCRAIQAMSPVDSMAAPEASYMPGYAHDIIMASGSFTQGSSIELSCDAPMKEPYTAYLQGGLTFAASRAAVLAAAGDVSGESQ